MPDCRATGDRADKMTLGRQGGDEVINLNPMRERRKDADILFEEVSADRAQARLYLAGGDDIVDARGGGIGAPSVMDLSVWPDTGNDETFGGRGYLYAQIEKGAGADSSSPARTVLPSSPAADRTSCAAARAAIGSSWGAAGTS